jgi:hypothetical protein
MPSCGRHSPTLHETGANPGGYIVTTLCMACSHRNTVRSPLFQVQPPPKTTVAHHITHPHPCCRDINRTVWGVDLVEEHLMASCGLPARPLIARKPLARLAEYSINAPVSGEKGGGWHTQCAAVLQCQCCASYSSRSAVKGGFGLRSSGQ